VFSPQQLAAALEQADVDGTAAALGALVFDSHPALAAQLAATAFGGALSKPQKQARARADALLMFQELGVTDYRTRSDCLALLYGKGPMDKLASGAGVDKAINREAHRIKNLICADSNRLVARLDILRAALSRISSTQKVDCRHPPTTAKP
jgi:hypothetical protein